MMLRWWMSLFAHYREYHEYGPPRLKYMGYLGVASFIALYCIRFTRPHPDLFDDIASRGTAFVLLFGMALKDHWPQRLRRYYLGYSYATVLYALPCFTVLGALERGGGVPAISNLFMVLSFLVLLTDWRNTLAMLVIGTAMAAAFYVLTAPTPHIPMDVVAQIPAFALIIVGGNLFKFSTEQIDVERKLQATRALAGSIAHEMRNPLARIRYNLERMQQALPAPTTTGQAQAIGPAEANALYRHLAESETAVHRGLQVIAMTLDEVGSKPLDQGAFSLLSAADATHKALHEYAFDSEEESDRVRVLVERDFVFRGDETAYLFVIFNLLKNAVYTFPTHPDARVTIVVGDHHVRVRDTGPGMAPDVVARLFTPFASIGKAGGTGLGLAYCKRVMHAFGGSIACSSVRGEFTEFDLEFPPVAGAETESQRDLVLQRARKALASARVLVVDDDAAQRLSTRHKLHGITTEVEQAADGLQALEALAKQQFDVVLLDLNMPVMDGYEVAARVRGGYAPANRDVAIVAYTSDAANVASVKTRRAGMDAFVGKPASQAELLQGILDALDRAQAGKVPPELAGRCVLLADDSAHSRKAVAAYLKHAGVSVMECGDGHCVVDTLRSGRHVDAVLLDINMPGMDGLATTRAIRALPWPAGAVPVIALTAHSGEGMVREAQSAGMSDFVTKPVAAEVLYGKLAELVSGAAPALPLRPTVSADAPEPSNPLLNIERLDSYVRIGMLDELLDDYLPAIAGLVGKLQRQAAQQDLPGCLDSLHSLLGMSGEAGAQALYEAVRRVYVPMLEAGRWPEQGGWAGHIAALAADTEKALKAFAVSVSMHKIG